MSRKAKNPNYLTFSATETIVTLMEDRGQLRTNDMGDFFMRNLIVDGAEKFTCASPDLERQLIDLGVAKGMMVGITREQYGRSVIWKVRRIGETVPFRRPTNAPAHRPAARNHEPFPSEKYASQEPPVQAFPEVEEAAPARNLTEASLAPARTVQQTAPTQTITASDNLLARCLCEAVDAVQIAQKYATDRGYAVAFGAPEVERIGVSIFIERTRNGGIYERKPAGQEYVNGKTNGHTTWQH